MICSVAFKGFKALPDSETKLERLTLLTGPNGAGKTARAHALQLAILGFVPGIAKTNRDIMATFSNGEKLVVEVRRDGVRCSRGFFRDKDGKVSEKFQLDLKRATKEQYAVALGGVKLFDLGAFQKLSDQGKIDYVFNVFPPGEDFRELEDKVEAKKAERNTLQKDIETLNATADRIHQQRAIIELPAGTLAEIKAQITEAEQQLSMARQLAEQNRVDLAKAKAREEEKRRQEALEAERAAERERLKQAERERLKQAVDAAHERALLDEIDKTPVVAPDIARSVPEIHNDPATYPPPVIEHTEAPAPFLTQSFRDSLQSVLETMTRTGCSACAAALVCRRELKKLREVA